MNKYILSEKNILFIWLEVGAGIGSSHELHPMGGGMIRLLVFEGKIPPNTPLHASLLKKYAVKIGYNELLGTVEICSL